MKKTTTKLAVSRETIRALTSMELARAEGGAANLLLDDSGAKATCVAVRAELSPPR